MKKKIIIDFNGQKFNGYLELAYYLFHNNIRFEKHIFPSNRMYLLRVLLEDKFNRKFNWAEIKQLLDDKSWQWRTREQVQEYIEQRNKDASAYLTSETIMKSNLPWQTLNYVNGKWQYVS